MSTAIVLWALGAINPVSTFIRVYRSGRIIYRSGDILYRGGRILHRFVRPCERESNLQIIMMEEAGEWCVITGG